MWLIHGLCITCSPVVHGWFTVGLWLLDGWSLVGSKLVRGCWGVALGRLPVGSGGFPADSWLAHGCLTAAIRIQVVRGWDTLGS
jgi:acyl dehydratase